MSGPLHVPLVVVEVETSRTFKFNIFLLTVHLLHEVQIMACTYSF